MADILLVEDELVWAMPIEQGLREAGHAVVWTDSTEKALSYLAQSHFDVLIVDLGRIREKSDGPIAHGAGLRLVQSVRQEPKLRGIRIVGTTACLPTDPGSDLEVKSESQRLGVDLYLEQPVDPMVLLEQLTLMLS